MLAMCAMARNGMGVAMLPCYVGDTDAGLRRIVKAPILEGMMDLWVLSHPDVRKAARVRAFTAYIAESILSNRDLFEGGRPRVEYSALSGT
jgi:DNA-binding transcriptional LysR family regulator